MKIKKIKCQDNLIKIEKTLEDKLNTYILLENRI
jgi:hypothetical protein